ncbi:MAG: YgcG family protein, partial [Zoogloea sp.]|nr:YgcG family protein [Zoogloea sp.]
MAAAGAQELQPVPALQAHVTDAAGLLSPDRRAALEAHLAAIEKEHGAQVAVLIVATTKPETIEQYGIRVTDVWQLGRKGIDDGVLVLLATQDRRLRLEVGRGLEGAIPDAVAKRIIADIAAPLFRQGDFAGGLDAAVEQIGKLIAGESLPAPKPASGADDSGMDLESMAALGMVA